MTLEELKKRVEDIKTLCMDRLDAKTADGLVLKEAFKAIAEVTKLEQSK